MVQVPDSDVHLWNAVRNDEEWAYNALFNRYWAKLYKTAYRYLKDGETCEEVVHDVFLNIWVRRKNLEIHAFEGFLLKAVQYQIYNRMRAAKLPVIYTPDDNYEYQTFDVNQGAERIKEKELEYELVYSLKQLPHQCQKIFTLSSTENLSNDEISLQLGISKRTVENQISLARKHLKAVLKSALLIIGYFILLK